MSEGMILITGATGNTNSFLIPALTAKGAKVRGLVRDASKAQKLRDAGVEIVVGSFGDAASLERALDGVASVFFVTPPHPEASAWAHAFIDAAKKTSRPRLVRLSVYGASPEGPTDNTRQHGRTDREIVDSGLSFAILRPNFFMQNLLASAATIAKDGAMYYGMGDGRIAMIDVRDIADAASATLLDRGWDGGIYELTGHEAITCHDVARAFSAALGRDVKYVAVPPEAVEKSLRDMGMGDWLPTVMRDYSRAYAANWGARVSALVPKLTGHPARSIDAFAREILAPALKK
jgi:uncharacterized protein YbjT (DUF2867 family)